MHACTCTRPQQLSALVRQRQSRLLSWSKMLSASKLNCIPFILFSLSQSLMAHSTHGIDLLVSFKSSSSCSKFNQPDGKLALVEFLLSFGCKQAILRFLVSAELRDHSWKTYFALCLTNWSKRTICFIPWNFSISHEGWCFFGSLMTNCGVQLNCLSIFQKILHGTT